VYSKHAYRCSEKVFGAVRYKIGRAADKKKTVGEPLVRERVDKKNKKTTKGKYTLVRVGRGEYQKKGSCRKQSTITRVRQRHRVTFAVSFFSHFCGNLTERA